MIDKYVAKKLKDLLDNVRYYEEHKSYKFEELIELFKDEDTSEAHTLILNEIMEEVYPEELEQMKEKHIKDYWSGLEFAKCMEITEEMREVALYEYHPLFANEDCEYFDFEDYLSQVEKWINNYPEIEHFTEMEDYEIFERYAGMTFYEWMKTQNLDEEETEKDIEECYGSLHSYFLDYGDHLPAFYLNISINEPISLEEIKSLPSFENTVFISNGYGYDETYVVEAFASKDKTLISFAYYDYTTNQIDPVVSFNKFMMLIQELRDYLSKEKAA